MYSNSDAELDSAEFLNFLKHNESALNITYSNTLETNLLLRYGPNSSVFQNSNKAMIEKRSTGKYGL